MVVPVRENLKLIKTLISNIDMQLKVWEDNANNLFISSTSINPKGTVYYDTDPAVLCMFLEDRINLQTLFIQGAALLVEIETGGRSSLYSTRDVEIELKCGQKTFRQLRGVSPFDVW
jgi:hypothetical protein